MTNIDMSLEAVLRAQLLFAIFVVACELLGLPLIMIRLTDSLIFNLPVDTDVLEMLIFVMMSHF